MISPRPDSKPAASQELVIDRTPNGRRANLFLWVFCIVMILVAGGGFGIKLYEFATALSSSSPMRFAFIPVLTYLIVASGFACLFVWAYLTGQFRQIEAAKYRMLEMQREIDLHDGVR